ncbi:alpha/beta hydrolase fold protein [Calothrix sp. NIES-4071]|nr:alpha/beta hydrolase fold protein [Calothrix sp. NIES-4071]BAZ55565.1 alpha/beta hydrolase fold protein [Calothrix sp. NIES-4105]
MIRNHEGLIKSTDGTELYYQSWHPENEVRGIVAIVHGLGGHSGTYSNIVQHLIPNNYAIYGIDLRGNGKSPGQRAYINSWNEYREDVGSFLKFIASSNAGTGLFLFGHSLGGLIVLDYVLRSDQEKPALNGLIAFTPALGDSGVSPIKIIIGQILSKVYPRFSMNTGIDRKLAARDEKVITLHIEDKLRHTVGTARLSTEFSSTLAWVQAHASQLNIPFLMMLAGADKVTLPEGSRNFFEKITFTDKELREYPESYHELHDDYGYQEVLSDLQNWLERHL